jgi:proteasome beta subunit
MTLPLFPIGEDPGPSFAHLLNRLEQQPRGHGVRQEPGKLEAPAGLRGIVHGTTIAALLFSGGTVVAGDRRATEGHAIAHRGIEKVFPADRYSAVAIAGAAGPALEMVRLFQTQLEHYEKVEGTQLSLEGKANQLAQMVRGNLPLAMEGLAVLPLFAGYDLRLRTGRIFSFDLTGGRYEELEYHTTGSGGRDAKNTIKLGFDRDMAEREAVELAVRALYEAADEDSATGGPDPLRGIYPVVAVIDENGYRRLADDLIAEAFAAVLEGRRRAPISQPPATAARHEPGESTQS